MYIDSQCVTFSTSAYSGAADTQTMLHGFIAPNGVASIK